MAAKPKYKNGEVYWEKLRLSMDPLLPVVLIVMTWLLSERYYPEIIFLETSLEYWFLGGITALCITLSIIIHEIGHVLAARSLKIPIRRIHLYLFGGMAELQHRPSKPLHEAWIALAGPLASLILAAISWGIYEFYLNENLLPYYLFRFLALINLLISLFNLIPIFPLDGGRIARSLFWLIKGSFIFASRLTYKMGSYLIALLFLGAVLDFFFLESRYTVIAGILALYMFYTYYTGRGELTYIPEIKELMQSFDATFSTEEIIELITNDKPKVAPYCIFPLVDGYKVEEVIDGLNVDIANNLSDIRSFKRLAQTGDFIEVDQLKTFRPGTTYNADYLPVLQNGIFYGMANAKEFSFWLYEHYIAGFELKLSADAPKVDEGYL